MEVRIACRQCAGALAVAPRPFAQTVRCPACGTFQVVQVSAAPPATPSTSHPVAAREVTSPGARATPRATPRSAPRPGAALPAARASVPPRGTVTLSCRSCGKRLRPGGEFCTGCGTAVADDQREALRASAERTERMRGRRLVREGRERQRKIRSASTCILVIGFLFLLWGTFAGFYMKTTVEQQQERYAELPQDELILFPEEEEVLTVAEVRERLDMLVRLAFGVHYVLAVIMFGLFFWSRRSPFPAIVTALCVYVVVHLLSAVLDPQTIVQGLLLKVFFVLILIGGIKMALQERRLQLEAAASNT